VRGELAACPEDYDVIISSTVASTCGTERHRGDLRALRLERLVRADRAAVVVVAMTR
jgi:hypothetical protein